MKRPSGDHDGSNSGQGDRARRLSPAPSALMDQTSWKLSKTIRPESAVRSIGDPFSVSVVEGTTREPDGTTGEPDAPSPSTPEQLASRVRVRTTVSTRIPAVHRDRTSGSGWVRDSQSWPGHKGVSSTSRTARPRPGGEVSFAARGGGS